MIADWDTDGVFLADKFRQQHPQLFAGLRQVLLEHGVDVRILEDVRDIWAKDYCPVHVGSREFVKFKYDPDYLKGYPHLRTGNQIVEAFEALGSCRRSSIVLDGGNVVSSGTTAILTDKIYNENPQWARKDLRDELRKLLQVEQLIVAPKEPYDRFGHSDSMVRFIDESIVVVNDYSLVDAPFGNKLGKELGRFGLKCQILPYCPEKKCRKGIRSAVGCYTNFLQTRQVVVVPSYGRREDRKALETLRALFPGVPVVPLDCTELARNGGVLNCVSANFQCAAKKWFGARPTGVTAHDDNHRSWNPAGRLVRVRQVEE